MINSILLYGYILDPYHVAFYLASAHVNSSDPNFVVVQEKREMSLELVFDICLCIDIVIKSLTSFQKDVSWVKSIYEIVWNYARGTMFFDIAASIPTLFLDMNSQWFNLKLIRFIHVRSVFGWVADMVKILLNRFGLDKGTIEKASHIINLIIVIFSAIHIIGCGWIAVGQITACSWLDQVACEG